MAVKAEEESDPVLMKIHGDGVVPKVMGRHERGVAGLQAGIFMESGSGEEAKFLIVKDGQLDSGGSVWVVESERRQVRDRQQEGLGWKVESTAFVRAGVESSRQS